METHADTDAGQSGIHEQPAIRPNAFHEANILHTAFFGRPLPSAAEQCDDDDASSDTYKKSKKPSPKNERLCIGGHRETIFGLSLSPDGKYMASASQDSTICIWDVASHRRVTTLTKGLDDKFECLRVAWMMNSPRDCESSDNESSGGGGEKYLLASAGADGIVRLWSGSGEGKLKWHPAGILDHYLLEKNDTENGCSSTAVEGEKEEKERPQVYALQFVHSRAAPDKNILLTSANDTIYLWNIVDDIDGSDSAPQSPNIDNTIKRRKFLPHLSVRFSQLQDETFVNQFGGDRNPNNELYIFDAAYSESNDLLGVALSDGTCRVLSIFANDNSNGAFCQDQCVLSLPPGYFPGNRGGHLTALSWDKSGTRLATCIASGRVVLWLLQVVDDRSGAQVLHPSCIAVLEGGHDAGRPLFGAKYCGGENEELLMSWGIDGKVCLWDSYSVGEVISPLCTLMSHSDYPIYALDVVTGNGANTNIAGANAGQKVHIAVGGGNDGGFLGVPAYLYDV